MSTGSSAGSFLIALSFIALTGVREASAASYRHPSECYEVEYPDDWFDNASGVLRVGTPLHLRSYTHLRQMPPAGEAEITVLVLAPETNERSHLRMLARDSRNALLSEASASLPLRIDFDWSVFRASAFFVRRSDRLFLVYLTQNVENGTPSKTHETTLQMVADTLTHPPARFDRSK